MHYTLKYLDLQSTLIHFVSYITYNQHLYILESATVMTEYFKILLNMRSNAIRFFELAKVSIVNLNRGILQPVWNIILLVQLRNGRIYSLQM